MLTNSEYIVLSAFRKPVYKTSLTEAEQSLFDEDLIKPTTIDSIDGQLVYCEFVSTPKGLRMLAEFEEHQRQLKSDQVKSRYDIFLEVVSIIIAFLGLLGLFTCKNPIVLGFDFLKLLFS